MIKLIFILLIAVLDAGRVAAQDLTVDLFECADDGDGIYYKHIRTLLGERQDVEDARISIGGWKEGDQYLVVLSYVPDAGGAGLSSISAAYKVVKSKVTIQQVKYDLRCKKEVEELIRLLQTGKR